MTSQARMNDAAIALSRVLSAARIRFGIFGGYAIATYGGPRESKDVDCLVASNKQKMIDLLDGKEGFTAVSQSRDDYVAFLWSDRPDRSRGILVEIFPEQFQGARYEMQDVSTTTVSLTSTRTESQPCQFLDVFSIFKGKLKAAERRNKFHDSADLRWLAKNFKEHVTPYVNQLDVFGVGLVMQRYPELESTFRQLGINVQAAKQAAAGYDVTKLPPLARGDVQLGLLGKAETVLARGPISSTAPVIPSTPSQYTVTPTISSGSESTPARQTALPGYYLASDGNQYPIQNSQPPSTSSTTQISPPGYYLASDGQYYPYRSS